MLTPDTLPASDDIPALEAAFCAFVLFPNGDDLSGFSDADQMVRAFTDGVAVHLCGDLNPLPEDVARACLDYAASYHGLLLGLTYRDAAAMVIARWQGARERFAAAFAASAA